MACLDDNELIELLEGRLARRALVDLGGDDPGLAGKINTWLRAPS